MSHDPETTFLIQMAAVAVQGVPSDWVSSGPIIGALLNLADLPLCAASDAAAARTLVALGARLPVASAPESCAQASIGLLVLDAPGEMSVEWQQVLAPGALVVTRSATGPVLDADGSLHVYFEIDAGMALDLCRGGQNDALRAFVEDASRRPGLTDCSSENGARAAKQKYAPASCRGCGLGQQGAVGRPARSDLWGFARPRQTTRRTAR